MQNIRPYDASADYECGDLVFYDKHIYFATRDLDRGDSPDANESGWKLFPAQGNKLAYAPVAAGAMSQGRR